MSIFKSLSVNVKKVSTTKTQALKLNNIQNEKSPFLTKHVISIVWSFNTWICKQKHGMILLKLLLHLLKLVLHFLMPLLAAGMKSGIPWL